MLLLAILCSAAVGEGVWDSEVEVERAVFASCNRVRKFEGGDDLSQPAWTGMEVFGPEALWWVGDAVYPDVNGDLEDLKRAYDEQNEVEKYKKFKKTLKVMDGTWDDHDYGINDGGKDSYTPADRLKAQNLFLDFLGTPADSPRRSRPGVYSAHKIKSPHDPTKSVAVIFLDTRSHRDPFAVPSIGGYNIPGIAVVSAVTRTISSMFGVYSQGDVLGPDQWEWLENIVKNSKDDVQGYLVVSSIQVNTSMPTVESWGHFPAARRRLYSLFNYSKGVLFISGDVHFGEVAPNELTTSGLTHSCTSPFYGALCTLVLNTWTSHRSTRTSFVTTKNYLTVSFNWAADTLQFTIRDTGNHPLLYKDHTLSRPTPLHDTPPFALAPEERVLFLCVTGTLLAIAGFLLITPHI